MAMFGKTFQRTTSMAQIGPDSNLHAERAQSHRHHHQTHREEQEGEAGEERPVNRWEILKNAETMMKMMMGAKSAPKSGEEGLLLQERQAGTNEKHPQIGLGASAAAEQQMSTPSTLIIPTHHFLDLCFYCKRRLRPERDIFIYRGDAAFCTEECRHRQILSDETLSTRASKKATAETAVAA